MGPHAESGQPVNDPGFGPPKGSLYDSPHAGPGVPLDQLAQRVRNRYGDVRIDANDPAFMPPHDAVAQGDTRARTNLIYRDIPLVTVQNTWTVERARGALYAHMAGIFDLSSQLMESVIGDDRVTATIGSRTSGLFGREVRFEPANDSDAARECMLAWQEWWPRFTGDAAFSEMNATSILMGFAPAQLVWDTSRDIWGPYMRPWHPRFTYYDWDLRKYIAMSLDGNLPIIAGDGKWLLHAPHGQYRGWIRGAIRAVTEPWLLRHFAFRDMARFSEVHGIPIRKAWTPSVADPKERAQFETNLQGLGAETTILLPKGVDGRDGDGYDLELLEAKDTAWEVFPGLIDRCDMAIVLALLFQNLTTEVKGGSFAATSSHMDIRQGGLQWDNQGWKNTLYSQVGRPFAYLNFGDADLAPWTYWDVAPREDFETNAKQFAQFGTALEVLRRGGIEFTDTEEVRRFAAKRFGLDGLPDFKITTPVSGGGLGK